MAQKKYISLSKLSTFLDNLKNTFATITHKHTISDLTDYVIDGDLDETSRNPIQNRVITNYLTALGKAIVDELTKATTYDDELSDTSTNSVQNKVLTEIFVALEEVMMELYEQDSTNLETAKSYADSGDTTTLSSAEEYTDNAVAQKSAVQLDEDFLSTLNIHNVTQDEYNEMLENGTLDETALYLTPEDETIDLSGYATSDHTHDDRYYTEEEIDVKLAEVANAASIQIITWGDDD